MENFDLQDQWLAERMDKELFKGYRKAITFIRKTIAEEMVVVTNEGYGELDIDNETTFYWMASYDINQFVFSLMDIMGDIHEESSFLKFYVQDMRNPENWTFSTTIYFPELGKEEYPLAFPIGDLRWFCLFFRYDPETQQISLNGNNYMEFREQWEKLCEFHNEEGLMEYQLDFKDLKEYLEE